jgi:hypothetical protein
MSDEVTVLCGLGAGLIIEVGVGIDANGTPGRGPEYARAVLAGSNSHRPRDQRIVHEGTRVRTDVIPAPHAAGLPPGVTRVDAKLWERWVAAHVGHAALKNGLLRALKPGEDIAAVSAQMQKTRTGFEPLAPGAMPKGISPAS